MLKLNSGMRVVELNRQIRLTHDVAHCVVNHDSVHNIADRSDQIGITTVI